MSDTKTIVNSWNEWDPLKHVIVGRADGTCIPAPEPALDAKVPEDSDMRGQFGPRTKDTVDKANQLLDDFTKNAPSDPKEKIKFLFEIYIQAIKDNKVLCLNVYSQYFIVNYKARYKLFKNQVISSLLEEMNITDDETVKKIALDFAILLNRYFTYDLSVEDFQILENQFFHKLDNLVNP